MSRTFTTTGLSDYLQENINAIGLVRAEVEQIQAGFQDAYVEWKNKHDAELAQLSELVARRRSEIGTPLEALIQAQIEVELKKIFERRKDLREQVIPKYQREIDETLRRGQAKIEVLRQKNPQLNTREENIKQTLSTYNQELKALNEKIRQLSRGLGGIFNFGKIGKLDRQRQQLIGRIAEKQDSLRDTRKEWDELEKQTMTEETQLQLHWQEVVKDLAERQSELNYLDDEAGRQALASQRAIQNVLDELKTPVHCPAADLKSELDAMVEYNQQTDDYHTALATVGGVIGMLGSIQEGMRRFDTSLEGLRGQETMHSEYLKPLGIDVADGALAFNQGWAALRQRVADEKYLAVHPTEFIQSMQPVMADQLSETRLKAYFESLGDSLKRATAAWG
jgi:chromosome segregation ATPase